MTYLSNFLIKSALNSSDEGFISEIQCILSIEIAPESEKLINKLLYKIKGDIKFHLNIVRAIVHKVIDRPKIWVLKL